MSSTSEAVTRERIVDPAQPTYRWWVLGVTSLGALLASLTSGTLVIALPDILRDLHTDLFALLGVVGYTLVSSMDPQVMLAVFSGTQVGSQGIDLAPFINALHLAFFAGVIASVAGAIVSWLRGPHQPHPTQGAAA